MTQWEYRIEFIDLYVSQRDPKPEIMLMLNTLGAEGWEAVTSLGSRELPINLRQRFPEGSGSPEIHLHTGNLRCWRWSTLHGQFGKPEGHAVQFQ